MPLPFDFVAVMGFNEYLSALSVTVPRTLHLI